VQVPILSLIKAHLDVISANWIDKHTVDVIEPIALRAPEVILGAEWGPSAEIWGLGCVVGDVSGALDYYSSLLSSGICWPEAGL
jgi:serine/threonine-protein kinase SRPK3